MILVINYCAVKGGILHCNKEISSKRVGKMKCAAHGQSVEEQSASDLCIVTVGKTQQPTIPKVIGENVPPVLSELRNDEAVHMDYSDILSMCKDVEISVSEEQAKAVEAATRDQASSKLWFQFPAASKMKTTCCTEPTQPAQSFIKSVCYPESYKFTSKATTWGCNHEKFACDMFIDVHKKCHENVKVRDTGFFINPSVPFLGASPDGLVFCDCCGVSVIEVKCPFCVKSDKGKHQYFYQVQTQLGVCKLESAYFVVWTEKDLHVEQIVFDEAFWDIMCQKSKQRRELPLDVTTLC
uniref:YqaJ viral recombinase domain-containing protein n=1 Tax=Gouania willdenowi TaxID=441366 RepID=A0A8C5ELC2_GOUWI